MGTKRILLDYQPAQLKRGKEWVIEFYILDPSSKKMLRKRNRVRPMKDARARLKYAMELVTALNEQLSMGWNPLTHHDSTKAVVLFSEAVSKFLQNKRGLRPDTLRSYTSFISMLHLYMMKKYRREQRVNEWGKENAIDYLRWIYIDRENSPRTHNNHRDFCILLWNWFERYGYAFENPFKQMDLLKVPAKERIPIPPAQRLEIAAYFNGEQPLMLLVMHLIFSAGLRRTEVTKLRVRDVDLGRAVIMINPSIAKMGEMGTPTLNHTLIHILHAYLKEGHAGNYFLIGAGWAPGHMAMKPKKLSDIWQKMRRALSLDKRYQLYSLRDSGIEQMILDGHDLNAVRIQFRHSSLEMTSKYAIRSNPRSVAAIRESEGGF
jgi:integrase/recombinase XerD